MASPGYEVEHSAARQLWHLCAMEIMRAKRKGDDASVERWMTLADALADIWPALAE